MSRESRTSATVLLITLGVTVMFSVSQGLARLRFSDRKEVFVAAGRDNGIISKPCQRSVDETVERLKGILKAKGMTLFVVIDHSGEAEKAGLKMLSTKLVIFGSPKAGTPLMQAAPSSAIDLPLKILVWQDPEGKVWASYNSPQYLLDRHGLAADLLKNISAVEVFATEAAE